MAIMLILLVVLLLMALAFFVGTLLTVNEPTTDMSIAVDIVVEWKEVIEVEGCRVNHCRHLSVSYLGSNQFQRRIRCLDCGAVRVWRVF
jgi:hypothetical protein